MGTGTAIIHNKRMRQTASALVLAALLCFNAQPGEARAKPQLTRGCWVGSWASSQQIPEPHNALPASDLQDATLRQVVRTTLSGKRIRIRLSNQFGTGPLRISSVHVARSADPASARLQPDSGRAVTFFGSPEVLIPAGAFYISDPIDLAVPALTHLAISMHLPDAPAQQTSHPGSRATSYLLRGNHVAAFDLRDAKTVNHWYQLAGVDVQAGPAAAAVVTLGDSITDGFGVQPNTDSRWPNYLANRLKSNPATRNVAVLNQGIGGNRVLVDGLGPNALARFERDVLGQPGADTLIMLHGVNDLGSLTREAPASPEAQRTLVAQMIGAYRQMVGRARERGMRVLGATILPYVGSAYYHPDAANEADRQAINAWIRAPGNFDAVIDFDRLLRDPANPTRLRPEFDSGDHLHPSIAGYRKMAEAVPIALLKPRAPARPC